MKTLLVLAAVVFVVRMARPLLLLQQLLRTRVWRTRGRLLTDEEVPPYTRDGLQTLIAQLEALGFQRLGWMAFERDRAPDDIPRPWAILYHASLGAYARAAFSSTPDPGAPWVVTFWSVGTDGRVLRTFGGGEQSPLGEPPGTIAITPYAATIPQQWEAHCASSRAANVVPASHDHDAVFALMRDRDLAFFDSLVRDGKLLPAENSSYVSSWSFALRAMRPILSDMAQRKTQRERRETLRRSSLQPLPEVPVEQEVAAYRAVIENTSGRPRASFLAALFAVSLALFVVAGWYSTGAATTTAIVLGVVFFHELGHYVAMRGLGYVDTTIFFVPFLGGVAAGRKDEATMSQRMIVLLAGPLPGLLVAAALALLGPASAPRLHEILILVATINLFNLLPILPLDGGQIAHMLLFARRPWLDVASRAVAGVGLIAIGWAASAVFLALLGVFALLQLPRSRRQSKLRQQFREARIARPNEPTELLLFRVLRSSPLASLPFAQKIVLARATLAQTTLDAPPRAGLVGWLAAYGSVFVLGCAAVLLTFGAAPRANAAARGPRTVVASAPLECATSPSSVPEEEVAPPEAIFDGVGVFDTREALVAARSPLIATVPDAISRSVGSMLFVWTRSFGEPDEEDDGNAIASSMSVRSKRMAGALRGAGGRYFDHVLPVIECTAPDAAQAQLIDEALEEYRVASRNGMVLPAPWAAAESSTEAQRLARRTFLVAMTAYDASTMNRAPIGLWSLLTGGRGPRTLAEYRARQVRATEAALAAERATRPIDEEVARLVIARPVVSVPSERERINSELRDRLGATLRYGPGGAGIVLKVSRIGVRVRIEIPYLQPPQVDSDVRPVLPWLCAQSCVDPHLVLETQ